MGRKLLKIMLVDDDAGDAMLVRRHLEGVTDYDIKFTHVVSCAECRKRLAEGDVDLIIVDYMLGAETGLALLSQLRSEGETRPIIVMTGQGDECLVRDLLQKGADDYLPKRDASPDTLRRSIDSAISRWERRKVEARNEQLALQLREKNEELVAKNKKLAELYETAHEFVDNVSHEFRTPLTVIKEFSSILHDGLVGEVSAEQKQYLETVLDRVDDLATMVDDMLDMSKLETGMLGIARRRCDVGEIVERVRSILERKAAAGKVRLRVPRGAALPPVYCDPEKIGRVIINLCINAIKFSPEGSEVLVWAKEEPETGLVRLGVTDHGPGIEADKLEEIFGRFRQLEGDIRSSTRGFGLGLNIARELVHLNFGEIGVASKVGEGSTFDFTVPQFQPRSLIHRYLGRLEGIGRGITFISLIRVEVPAQASEAQQADTERFIQHQIRKSDLVFSSPEGGWLMICACNQRDMSSLIHRVESAHQLANRNRPGMGLPDLRMELIGTWDVNTEQEPLIHAFEAELGLLEAVHG